MGGSFGQGGDDTAYGCDAGLDIIAGMDASTGGSGADLIHGDATADNGQGGADLTYGGSQSDIMYGGEVLAILDGVGSTIDDTDFALVA